MLNPIYLVLEYVGQRHAAQGEKTGDSLFYFNYLFILLSFSLCSLYDSCTFPSSHPSYTHTHTQKTLFNTVNIQCNVPICFFHFFLQFCPVLLPPLLHVFFCVSFLSCLSSRLVLHHLIRRKKKEKDGIMLLAWLLALFLTEVLR